ncbi:hypothetical protein UPYG_G00021930 [Umbra pygmaea]|uniref:CREG-like beta-barrel domain-containing protein n=1 Tax=Umbra pygmaea TaxID=75934 RepID=A0ABD0XN60_UMBPY
MDIVGNMNAMLVAGFLLFFAMPSELYKIPPHEEVAKMARFVANQCDWASMATISTHEPVQGQPFSNAFSVSDGPVGSGTGVPYMYLTRMEISVQDLKVNPQASLSMSLAQTDFCKDQGFDPQSPLCAHIIFSGFVVEINGTEATFAKKALFSRHPEMSPQKTTSMLHHSKYTTERLVCENPAELILVLWAVERRQNTGVWSGFLENGLDCSHPGGQMDPRTRVGGLLVLSSALPYAEASSPLYDPKLCYILDGFLLLYGVLVTGLLIKEKWFTAKPQGKGLDKNDGIYSDLNPSTRDPEGYGEIKRLDPERGVARGNRGNVDDTYTPLQRPTDDTYREIAVTENKRRKHKDDKLYQVLNANKDTYDALQMQPLPPPPPR